MSKAEDRALEAYPVLFSERNGYDNTFKDRRESYIKGYHQAEKDLELTWEDVKLLRLAFDATDSNIAHGLDLQPMTKEYYQEVLKRFKEMKEK